MQVLSCSPELQDYPASVFLCSLVFSSFSSSISQLYGFPPVLLIIILLSPFPRSFSFPPFFYPQLHRELSFFLHCLEVLSPFMPCVGIQVAVTMANP